MSIFLRFRLFMLPFAAMDKALPKQGLVYEVGSGYGVLASALAQARPKRRVVGIDLDEEKIQRARDGFKRSNLEYALGDALHFPYKYFDGAIMSDFLHHLPFSMQERCLDHLSRRIKIGGVLVVKEMEKDDGVLTLLSRLYDFLLYPGDRIYYRNIDDWTKIFTKLGFSVSVRRECKWFPGSTFLFCCKKIGRKSKRNKS